MLHGDLWTFEYVSKYGDTEYELCDDIDATVSHTNHPVCPEW